jgi:hypothetical protein
MANRPKRPRDPAQLAKFVVDMATGQIPPDKAPEAPARRTKAPLPKARKTLAAPLKKQA